MFLIPEILSQIFYGELVRQVLERSSMISYQRALTYIGFWLAVSQLLMSQYYGKSLDVLMLEFERHRLNLTRDCSLINNFSFAGH